ncbi:putative DNA-binding protein [compost metagenome]
MLVDFYEPLLTEKQRTFLKLYVHDDFSLGEIAENFEISRQAVYEHIKRAEQSLVEYEDKLGLLAKHEQRIKLHEQLSLLLEQCEPHTKEQMNTLFDHWLDID